MQDGERGDELKDGAEIPMFVDYGPTRDRWRTSPGFDLTELLNGFRPLFEILQPADVNQLATSMIKVLQGEGGTIEGLLGQTAQLTNFMADRDEVIGQVMTNLTPVLENLAGQGGELQATVVELKNLMTGLARDRKSIGGSIDSIGTLVGATSDLLQDVKVPMTRTTDRLATVAAMFADSRTELEDPGRVRHDLRVAGPDRVLRERAQRLPVLLRYQDRQPRGQSRRGPRPVVGGVPMKPMSARDPFKIGLVAVVLLALVAGVVLFLSLANFGTTSYTAVLEHTGGLRAGESVQVHGVTKGKVTSIELDKNRVVVDFVLDSDIDLGSRTEATVKVATLLGTHYLEVDPSGAGELADGTIPLERTSVPYNLQDVIESGAQALDELDPELLAESLTQMADTLGASQDQIRPALEGVARLSEVVATRSDQVGALLTAARSVTDQLAASSTDIIAMMKQTNLVVTEVTSRRQAIHRLLVETTELARALESIVQSTKGKLEPALRDLNDVITFLNQQDDQLQHVLDVMAPAARYVANAAGNGPWVDLFAHEPALPADDAACRFRNDCR